MAQWGNKKQPVTVTPNTKFESTDGAPMGLWSIVNKGGGPNAHFGNTAGTRARTDLDIYASNTPGQFIKNMAIGVYGQNANDMSNPGTLSSIDFNFLKNGSMYDPDKKYAVNVVMANGFVNNTAITAVIGRDNTMHDTAGHCIGLNKSLPLTGLGPSLEIHVDPPPMWEIYANSSCIVKGNVANGWPGGFKFAPGKINTFVDIGSYFTYYCPNGETPIAPLVSGQKYMVLTNPYPDGTFPIQIYNGVGAITITDFRANITAPAPSHFIQGDTFEVANAVFTPGVKTQSTHPGWVIKKQGTGGRANRVQYECLVAMGTISNT